MRGEVGKGGEGKGGERGLGLWPLIQKLRGFVLFCNTLFKKKIIHND